MNMKVRKSVIAFLMATTMVGSTAVPAMAATANVTVSIKATGLTGDNAKDAENYIVAPKTLNVTTKTDTVTALDALKAISGASSESDTNTVGTTTYHYQGILCWYNTKYGNYIPAIKLDNHNNSDKGKFFADNGTVNETKNSIAGNRGNYLWSKQLKETEVNDMEVSENSTWNNTVHKEGWLSEKDYNNYSGWMCEINKSTNNGGVDTVVKNGDTICLDYSMMMGLDLGYDSYVENSEGKWVPVSGWKKTSDNGDNVTTK